MNKFKSDKNNLKKHKTNFIKLEKICRKISFGIVTSIISLTIIFNYINKLAFAQIVLYDIIPSYKFQSSISSIFNSNSFSKSITASNNSVFDGVVSENVDIVGIDDIHFEEAPSLKSNSSSPVTIDNSKLDDLNYLAKKFYIVDTKTSLSSDYFNFKDFSTAKIKIDNSKPSNTPKVLIFHTHPHEMFKDSNTNDINDGIIGAGTRLASLLEQKGIKTLHITNSTFDTLNGKPQRNGAYERMEPVISKVLKDNPSIELVIDLHRDGVNEKLHLVENINGKPTAKIMFFNGISRVFQNGSLKDISNLKNPFVKQNLALSFNLQKKAMEKYPNFTRKIYIKPYRYSLHMKPLSLLIEAGAQTNSKQEIFNAMELLSDIIYEVIFS